MAAAQVRVRGGGDNSHPAVGISTALQQPRCVVGCLQVTLDNYPHIHCTAGPLGSRLRLHPPSLYPPQAVRSAYASFLEGMINRVIIPIARLVGDGGRR